MYDLVFESFDDAEDFRRYLKDNAGIDLPQARLTSNDENTAYEFESYGYPGFVMTMVYRICFSEGVDYTEMGRLPQSRKEKLLEDQLFSHAMLDVKVWRPPGIRSREFRWVTTNLGLSERCIRRVLERAEKKYEHWLKMDSRYSFWLGLGFLAVGALIAFRAGSTHWSAILFFSGAVLFLLFGFGKAVQYKKTVRSKLPR